MKIKISSWSYLKASIVILLLLTSFVFTSSAFAQPAEEPPVDPADVSTDVSTQCTVEKIGWILCPFLEVTAKAADQSFKLLADNFLQVEKELYDDSNAGTKAAWSAFRDIANVMFVIAFLVLIYSQMTGMGVSNYGLKKMLPRLIIAAIMVNSSFYVCQIIVDVTNILGFELKNFLWSIAQSAGPNHALDYDGTNAAASGAGGVDSAAGKYGLYVIALGVLASAAVFALLGILGSIIVTVIVTCLVIVIILLLRKAIIVLLIVISPVAFVAYLLPNTEKYFSKWLDMFWKLLLVFPIVSLLFGAGQLASTIILNASAGANGAGEATDFSAGLIAAGIAVAPLMAVYAVLKGALAAAGAINGAVNALGSKAMGRAGKWAKNRDANSALGRGAAARKQGRQEYKDDKFLAGMQTGNKSLRGRSTRLMAGGVQGLAGRTGIGNTAFGKATMGSMNAQNASLGRAVATQTEKSNAGKVAGEVSRMRVNGEGTLNGAADALARAIENGDKVGAKAAEDILMGMGGAGADQFAKTIARAENAASAPGADGAKTAQTREMMSALKSYTMQNHAGVKDKSAGTYAWANDHGGATGGPKPIASHYQSAGSYAGLSDKQRASQSTDSARAMANTGILNAPNTGPGGGTAGTRLTSSKAAEEMGGSQRAAVDGGGYAPQNHDPATGHDGDILHRPQPPTP